MRLKRKAKRITPGIRVKKYNEGGVFAPREDVDPEPENELKVDREMLQKGVMAVESLNGILMKNPQSSATGLYGQLFEEIEGAEMLKGATRDEFAKSKDLQNLVWEERLKGNPDMFQEKNTGLLQDGVDIYEEYKPQLGDKLTYTPTELAALSNFLGRQGTRILMGDVMRDGMSMAEALPTLYGSNKEYDNKTPEQYIKEFRAATK